MIPMSRHGGVRLGAAHALVVTVLLCTGCTMTRQLEREDWGALGGSEDIVVVTNGGVRYELRSFQFLATGLVGRGQWAELQIPLDSIALVEVRERNAAAVALAVLAVGTAVGVLIAMGQSPERPEPQPSCPFVYSFDGQQYHFDSETFAGAIAPGLDRTDYDNLEHLRPVDGSYRLRLTNERPETQYTDELRLLVVDHPPGTLVVPDREGRVHVLTDPQAPLAAHDASGNDAWPEVSGEDGIAWRGAAPETADLDDPAQLRDGLVLSFARQPGATSARLLVRARNTDLAPFALTKFLELQGEELFDWYLRVGQDSILRERIRGWVAREGMLHVSVWQEGEWIFRDVLPDVGPALDKSQVVALDLGRQSGDTVLVRLESARGLWEIDRVAMDMGAEPPHAVMEVEPVRARDERGRDVRALLTNTDEQYYSTVEGAVADIEYPVPRPPAENWTRSVILKSRGFYYLYVDHRRPSQSAFADRILDEPLLGNRYVLGQLQADRR